MVAAFAVVLIYLIWRVSYAGIHYTARYTIRSRGASGEVQGTTVRVLSLTRSDQLADAEEGEPDLPYPGAVWVVAELEALRHDPAKEYYCGAQLIGPERRLWSTSSSPTKRGCSPALSISWSGSPFGSKRSIWCRLVTPTKSVASRYRTAQRRRAFQ